MPNAPLMVKVTPELKTAVEKAAYASGLDMSKWIRKVVAEAAGYDLAADEALDTRGRPRKYANEKERNKARAAAQRDRKAREDAVVAALMRQERLADKAALETWLVERGISLDDEPSQQAG